MSCQEDDLCCLQVDQHVARMRVGMKKAIEEYLFDHGTHKDAHQRRTVEACLVEGAHIRDLDPLDKFLREYAVESAL